MVLSLCQWDYGDNIVKYSKFRGEQHERGKGSYKQSKWHVHSPRGRVIVGLRKDQ